MKFGLTDKEYQYIFDNVIIPLKDFDVKIFCFGSRAIGTHSKFSDLDLLFKCEKKTNELVNKLGQIKELLEQGNFPYKVDLVFESDIASSYKINIQNQLTLF